MPDKRRIAVVSPFIDKRHGTERCVAEQVERLAWEYGYEVHVYSQWVEDVGGVYTSRAWLDERVNGPERNGEPRSQGGAGRIIWHKVPAVPAPGLIKYLWWFAANHLWRWWDGTIRGARYDLLYSPGINCLDADAISVHIVFAEFHERVRPDLALRRNPPIVWPRILHRRLYYRLIMALEHRVYPRKHLALAAVSQKTARELGRFYGRDGDVSVIYHAVDLERFSSRVRQRLRSQARRELGLPEEAFGLLLIGNDWKNKGLPCLLDAGGQLQDSRLWVLVAGRDDRTPFEARVRSCGLEGQVRFLPLRPDVEFYYAAADAYVGPSLEDAFALPPAEAMACGLPVIVSNQAGVCEIITDGVDGLVLKDPRDARELAGLIRRVLQDVGLRHRLGERAVQSVRLYTWDRNAAETAAFLQKAMSQRDQP
jgi:glycosyltransferase involved in cell wall biosynthesis